MLAAGRLFSILQPIQKFGLLPTLGQQSRVRLKLSHQVGQKMYLSMTEQDYQGVRSEARLKTALALGISNASDLSDSDLDIAINRSDHIAHDLLHRFLDSYQQWWQKSIELADAQLPSPAERELLVKMIDERDEIRKTLLNYLGYVRARDVVSA